MSKVQIRVLEQKLKDGGYDLEFDDVISVPADLAETWCSHGWVEDVSGNIPTGERKVVGAELEPQKMVIKASAKKR